MSAWSGTTWLPDGICRTQGFDPAQWLADWEALGGRCDLEVGPLTAEGMPTMIVREHIEWLVEVYSPRVQAMRHRIYDPAARRQLIRYLAREMLGDEL